MSGNKYPKKFQLHLTEQQHENLRQAAFTAKVSMMEYVRGKIGDAPVAKVAAVVEHKQPVVQSKSISSTHTGTCSKCGAKGVKTTINREMKEVCYKCAGV